MEGVVEGVVEYIVLTAAGIRDMVVMGVVEGVVEGTVEYIQMVLMIEN